MAVYSTPTTKTPANQDKEKGVPASLEGIPDHFRIQVRSGEAILGIFKYENGGDAVFIANHNAFLGQRMIIQFKSDQDEAPPGISMFNRDTGKWHQMKLEGDTLTFDLAPAGGELLRLDPPPR